MYREIVQYYYTRLIDEILKYRVNPVVICENSLWFGYYYYFF